MAGLHPLWRSGVESTPCFSQFLVAAGTSSVYGSVTPACLCGGHIAFSSVWNLPVPPSHVKIHGRAFRVRPDRPGQFPNSRLLTKSYPQWRECPERPGGRRGQRSWTAEGRQYARICRWGHENKLEKGRSGADSWRLFLATVWKVDWQGARMGSQGGPLRSSERK